MEKVRKTEPNRVLLILIAIFMTVITASCTNQSISADRQQPTPDRGCSSVDLTTEELANCYADWYVCEIHAIGKDWNSSCTSNGTNEKICEKDSSNQIPGEISFQDDQIHNIPFTEQNGKKIAENKYEINEANGSQFEILTFSENGFRLVVYDSEKNEECSNDPEKLCLYTVCTITDGIQFQFTLRTLTPEEAAKIKNILMILRKNSW